MWEDEEAANLLPALAAVKSAASLIPVLYVGALSTCLSVLDVISRVEIACATTPPAKKAHRNRAVAAASLLHMLRLG